MKDSKRYIDWLKNKNILQCTHFVDNTEHIMGEGYLYLDFKGIKYPEFKELNFYINKVREQYKIEIISQIFDTMQNNVQKFCQAIRFSTPYNDNELELQYKDIPIFKSVYISPEKFIKDLLLIKAKDRQSVFRAIKSRYGNDNFNEILLEELEWLKLFQFLLLKEIESRKGRNSGHCLNIFNTYYLKEAIQKLEETQKRVQSEQEE